ncbi:MAG: cobyric acid synthase [Nitrososphaerales archaeon]
MVKFLMIQGTSSSAGKSFLVAAFCRILSDRGYRVAPLKAQNMSSNLYVTKDGLEMAKAQAIQAIAARTNPSPYMNPILLKPMGDYVSSVVLLGKAYRNMNAKYYYDKFVLQKGMKFVKQAIKKLSQYDIVVIEGAGSPAEINIADYDIANMRLAEMLRAPVLIVADIERGGCFASIVGTMQLLKPKHRNLVKGFIINKFRGDRTILGQAIASLQRITKRPVLGVVPFIDDMMLSNEDSLGIKMGRPRHDMINIAVIKYPNAINVADFEPLLLSSDSLNTYYVTSAGKLSDADLVLLPSSRDIMHDLKWMKHTKIGDEIKSCREKNIPIIGICEGFAMMSEQIRADGKAMNGLGLIDTSAYSGRKLEGTVNVMVASRKPIVYTNGKIFDAYVREHYTVVNGRNANSLLHVHKLNGKPCRFAEGCISKDGFAFGCFLYGLFDTPLIRNSVIEYLSRKKGIRTKIHHMPIDKFWDKQIQRFSTIVKDNIELEQIMRLI